MLKTMNCRWGPLAVAILLLSTAAPQGGLAASGIPSESPPNSSGTGRGWARLADMTSPHEYHAAVAVGGKIYVLGGEAIAKFEEYDPATNQWKVLPQMPTSGRSFLGAAAVDDKIYAIGGISRKVDAYATVEAYDLGKGSWGK